MASVSNVVIAGLGSRVDEFLVPILGANDCRVQTALGIEQLLQLVSRSVDLVLLDLPSAAELGQIEQLRGLYGGALLVIGPARNDKLLVAALERGADDYVQRPFRTDELLARIRAQLRRRVRAQHPLLMVGPLMIDTASRAISVNGTPVDLGPEEYTLLLLLATQPDYCYPASYLIEQVWGRAHAGETQLLTSAVSHLRALIDPDPANPRLLGGDPALGYWLRGSA